MRKLKFEPWTYAYRLFGKRIQRILPQFADLHNQLKKGGVRINFTAYLSFMIMCSIITFVVSMTLLPFLLPSIMHFSLLSAENFVFSLMFSLLMSLLIFIVIYAYPGTKSSQRKAPIEANLPYISSFMALLSSSNVPPRLIFRSMAKIETLREIHQEFGNIVRDVEVFGQDLLTSIVENMKYTPSKRLQEVLTGYVSTIRTGGDPTEYLRVSTENTIKEKMVKLDLMLESLSAMAEIYIMVLVAMPLLFIAMFAVLGMLGGGGGAMNPALMLYLLAYVGIPLMASLLIVVISTFTTG